MGLPRIIYNSKNIDFAEDVSEMSWDLLRLTSTNKAESGKKETLSRRTDVVVRVKFEMVNLAGGSDPDIKRKLRQFLDWAQAGSAWQFARDRSEVVKTTLGSSASVGATSLQLTSVTGVTAGKQYVIRNDVNVVTVLVKTNWAGSNPVTIEESIDVAFSSGDLFRSEEFWDGCMPGSGGELIAPSPIVEKPPMHFDFELTFYESRD